MSYHNYYGEQPDIVDANEVRVDASGSDWNMGDIRNSHLDQCNLSGSRLLRMWIKESTISQCWLNNSVISACVVSDVDWSGSDFSGAAFGNSLFINCKFENCHFKDAQFSGVSFVGCDFTGAIFDGAHIPELAAVVASAYRRLFRMPLFGTMFRSGDFSRRKCFFVLSASTIIRTDSRGRWLKVQDAEGSVRFNHIRYLVGLGPNFFGRYALILQEYGRLRSLAGDSQPAHRSVFARSSFRFAKLQGASFLNADLSGADLEGANLDDADLRNATVTGASFVGASLKRANLEGVDLSQAKTDGAKT